MSARRRSATIRSALVLLAIVLAAAPSPASRHDERLETPAPTPVPPPPESAGMRLFFRETFSGNGRTCATCHRPEDDFSLSPAVARRLHELDPGHPLFRPIDSDDGSGRDYTTLLEHALVRVTIPLHPNVRLADDATRRTIEVLRAVPSISNVALTAPYQQDGRFATLAEQVLAAVRDHFEPGREPGPAEVLSLAAFEAELFSPQRLRAIAPGGAGPAPEPGFSTAVTSPAARQGLDVFIRNCARCHGGETGSVAGGQAQQFSDVFVSEANRLGLPLLRLAFRNADGSETVVLTPDPGRAAITGRLSDLNAFDTPPLRGIKHTAPYFHDHSVPSLGAVIDHYNEFGITRIGFRDRDALIAYLESL